MEGQKENGPDSFTKQQRAMDELAAEGTATAKKLLDPAQFERLVQLERQRVGMTALFREDVRQALKLSDEQKDKIREINRRRGGTIKEAIDILSAEQKAVWDKLLGKPFDFGSLSLKKG